MLWHCTASWAETHLQLNSSCRAKADAALQSTEWKDTVNMNPGGGGGFVTNTHTCKWCYWRAQIAWACRKKFHLFPQSMAFHLVFLWMMFHAVGKQLGVVRLVLKYEIIPSMFSMESCRKKRENLITLTTKKKHVFKVTSGVLTFYLRNIWETKQMCIFSCLYVCVLGIPLLTQCVLIPHCQGACRGAMPCP